MSKLPTDLSGRQVRAALERVGFAFRRQKGSHMILRRDSPYARAVVPDHKQMRIGTLRQIIREAGLSLEEFQALLKEQSRLSSFLRWLHGFRHGLSYLLILFFRKRSHSLD
jgi:predicted RNA binding protein YcfA (HicA-like mRNA interferase family)